MTQMRSVGSAAVAFGLLCVALVVFNHHVGPHVQELVSSSTAELAEASSSSAGSSSSSEAMAGPCSDDINWSKGKCTAVAAEIKKNPLAKVARCRSGGWERFFCKKSCDTCDAKRPVCPGHAASKDPNSKGDCSCPSSAPICSHGGVTYQDPSVEGHLSGCVGFATPYFSSACTTCQCKTKSGKETSKDEILKKLKEGESKKEIIKEMKKEGEKEQKKEDEAEEIADDLKKKEKDEEEEKKEEKEEAKKDEEKKKEKKEKDIEEEVKSEVKGGEAEKKKEATAADKLRRIAEIVKVEEEEKKEIEKGDGKEAKGEGKDDEEDDKKPVIYQTIYVTVAGTIEEFGPLALSSIKSSLANVLDIKEAEVEVAVQAGSVVLAVKIPQSKIAMLKEKVNSGSLKALNGKAVEGISSIPKLPESVAKPARSLPATPETATPSVRPSVLPTLTPSVSPSKNPTLTPTLLPDLAKETVATSSSSKSASSSSASSKEASSSATTPATRTPTLDPTRAPTLDPSIVPTDTPTFSHRIVSNSGGQVGGGRVKVVASPRVVVVSEPPRTSVPTEAPTEHPTAVPTFAPTAPPTWAKVDIQKILHKDIKKEEKNAQLPGVPGVSAVAMEEAIAKFLLTAPPTFAPTPVPTIRPTGKPSRPPSDAPSFAPITGCYQIRPKDFIHQAWSQHGDVIHDSHALFKIVPGLAGRGTVSVESCNKPGHYYAHAEMKMILGPHDGTRLFKEAASFYEKKSLFYMGFISFEAFDWPDHFVTFEKQTIVLRKRVMTAAFKKAASWEVT